MAAQPGSFGEERILMPVNECDSSHHRSRVAAYLCCFPLKIGVRIYSALDTVLGLFYLLCSLHLLVSNKDYHYIGFDEILILDKPDHIKKANTTTSSPEQTKRKDLINTVLEECGGHHYIREHSPEDKKFQFDMACVLASVSAVGFLICGLALFVSTILSIWRRKAMAKLRKHRKKVAWVYLWLQIPWMISAFFAAILMYGENICEIDVKGHYRGYILWLTLLSLLIYKPHELAVVVYYIGELHSNAKMMRQLQLQQRKLRRMNKLRNVSTTKSDGYIEDDANYPTCPLSQNTSVSSNTIIVNPILAKVDRQYSDTIAPTVCESVTTITKRNQYRKAEADKTAKRAENKNPESSATNRENENLILPMQSDMSVTATTADVGNDDFEFDESNGGDPFDDQFL